MADTGAEDVEADEATELVGPRSTEAALGLARDLENRAKEEACAAVAPLPPDLGHHPQDGLRRAASVPVVSSVDVDRRAQRRHAGTTGTITTASERAIFDAAGVAVADVRLDDALSSANMENPVEFSAFLESEALLSGGYRAEALAARDGVDIDSGGPNQVDVLEFNAGVGRGHAVVDILSPNDATPAERTQRAINKAYHILDVTGSGHVVRG